MHGKRLRLLFAILFTIAAVRTYAQIRIQPISIASFADEDLSLLVARSAALGVAGSGCHAMAPRFGSPDGFDAGIAGRIARDSGADFLLLLRNARSGGDVEVEISIHGTEENSALARSAHRYPMDLYLDDRIEEQVAALLLDPQFEARRQTLAARPLPEAATPEISPEPAITAAAEPEPAVVAPVPPMPAVAEAPAATVTTKTLPFAAEELGPEPSPLALHVQGAPLIFVGSLSELFRYGALGSLSGTLRFLRVSFPLEAGVRVGVAQAFPGDAAQAGTVRMALFGLEAKIGIEASSRIALGFRLGGGPAVVMVEKPSELLKAKISSFAECGASALLGITPRVDFGLEMGAHILFEEIPPLAAFAPAVFVRFRP